MCDDQIIEIESEIDASCSSLGNVGVVACRVRAIVWARVFLQIDGLVQDWGDSIANALEPLQSCTNPSK